MNRRLSSLLIFLLVGVCLWILFIFEGEMANYGIYTLVNYNTHEILALIPFVCILVSIIWFLVVTVKSIKTKNYKDNAIAISLLVAALFFQISYISSQSNQIYIDTVAYVERIDPTKEEIVINKSGERVLLECPMTIFELLKVNEEYLISYQCKKNNPNVGKANLVQLIEN